MLQNITDSSYLVWPYEFYLKNWKWFLPRMLMEFRQLVILMNKISLGLVYRMGVSLFGIFRILDCFERR